MSQTRVLVTGGNGFLGSHLVRLLHQQGFFVRVLALHGTETTSVEGICDEIVEGNICQPDTLISAVASIDIVFHLAAMVTDWGPSFVFRQVNLLGTKNMLDASIQAGCKRFVHMSSLAVHAYRDIFHGDETLSRDATEPAYATTKKEAEDAVLDRQSEIEVVIIRPGLFPYGPGDVNNIAKLLSAFEEGKFGFVNGGHARFCTSYVTNLAEGMVLAATKDEAIGETFILCDNDSISWQEFTAAVAKHLNVPKPRRSVPYGLALPFVWCWEKLYQLFRIRQAPLLTRYRLRVARYHLVFSNEKAKRLLGYKPRVTFEEGIVETVKWYRESKAQALEE